MAPPTKKYVLEFEKPFVDLETALEEARVRAAGGDVAARETAAALARELDAKRAETYANLKPWDRVLLARHPDRPHAVDYIQRLIENPVELHGDRGFRDDMAVICGTGWFRGRSVVWMGQEKGRTTKEKVRHNFGSMHPEGYRKALRIMKTAAKFRLPILVLLDTSGAYPGIEAEERGIAEAIAKNILEMFDLRVPIVAAVIGEGGSGGALGIGIANRVLIQEYAYYSVISPEGCAAILWRDRAYAAQASAALKITAPDLARLGVVDEIITEPPYGAHRDFEQAARLLGDALERHLASLEKMSADELVDDRRKKFLAMGYFTEGSPGEGG